MSEELFKSDLNVDIKKIQNFLKKRGYITKVQRTTVGCRVAIPEAKLLSRSALNVEMKVVADKEKTGLSVDDGKGTAEFVTFSRESLAVGVQFMLVRLIEDEAHFPFELIEFFDRAGQQQNSYDFFNSFETGDLVP